MDVGALASLLESGRYTECCQAAELLVRHAALPDADRARAFLAQSYSLGALQAYQEALAPAELAVYFSKLGGAYDVAGHALCHLAVLYHDSRLHKRAIQCLDEYFRYFTLYAEARSLEGWVLAHTARAYQAMGRGPKALEYFQKAYRWQVEHAASPQQVDLIRGDLVWQCLKLGRLEPAQELLPASEAYLRAFPNDLDARARHLNNEAYRCFLLGHFSGAVEAAIHTVQIRGVSALRKAQACLTLHYTARAMGLWKEARGLGTLARIQASVCRRPDVEEEATRALLHLQHDGELPLMDELARSLGRLSKLGRSSAAATES